MGYSADIFCKIRKIDTVSKVNRQTLPKDTLFNFYPGTYQGVSIMYVVKKLERHEPQWEDSCY